jgi:lia operon protein LiaH
MPKYIAKQSIGHFRPGQDIEGLEAKQLQALLTSGAIEEYREPEEPKADGTAARLAELEKANAELTKANTDLESAKTKADQEVTELKAKVAELEKAKPAAKPKADSKAADETK